MRGRGVAASQSWVRFAQLAAPLRQMGWATEPFAHSSMVLSLGRSPAAAQQVRSGINCYVMVCLISGGLSCEAIAAANMCLKL
jgi:hypothetical protein